MVRAPPHRYGRRTLAGQLFLICPICDRDRKWSAAVRHLLETSGVRVVQTPFRAPNCNALAERSTNEECLDRLIPFGEEHLRRALAEFVAHYHGERNHQGLGNALIEAAAARISSAVFAAVTPGGHATRRRRMGVICSARAQLGHRRCRPARREAPRN
jgi:hypothetical protein